MRSNRRTRSAVTLGAMLLGLAVHGFGQATPPAPVPDWRSVVADHLSQRDTMGAARYLEEAMAGLEPDAKPEATALLAFLTDGLGNKTQARAWLMQFFDAYGGPNVSFPYLGIVGEADVLGYINSWRGRFPEVSAVSLVWDKKNPGPMPPETLMLGVDVTSDSLYRFSDQAGIMGGGMLHKGFNILSIPVDTFFEHSASHLYLLELRAGDINLKKEITIQVSLTPEPVPLPQQTLSTTKSLAYDLSFYVGDQLIVSSTRTELANEPLKLNIKPVNLAPNPLFKPPGPPSIWDPAANGISIVQAVGVISGLVKDLLTKKPKKTEAALDKLSVLGLSFFRPGPSNSETEVKATLTLQTRSVSVVQ